jgi:excisionase family DNA binding protein
MMDIQLIDQRLQRIEAQLLSQKTVLTFDEAAEYTGLSKSHLYKLTSTGGVPCYKPTGKRLYFSKAELDNWLLDNKKRSTDEQDTEAENRLLSGGVQ